MSSETALFRPAEEILASRDAPPPPAERRAETLDGAAAPSECSSPARNKEPGAEG